MKKNEFNSALRGYARSNLSPSPEDRTLVSSIYDALKNVLGTAATLQIGSYARFTAIKPLHDLDVLYLAGTYQDIEPDPRAILDRLKLDIDEAFENPTDWDWLTKKQTHSITIVFSHRNTEQFSVDVVPAYRIGTNEFGTDIYLVPELISLKRGLRSQLVEDVSSGRKKMGWIRSDPRGYNQASKQLNELNEDYRRASKILKGWRRATKRQIASFPIKSFHLEQAVFEYFRLNPTHTVHDAVFSILRNVRSLVRTPSFRDRADQNKFIDDYVAALTTDDRDVAEQAADHFMISLEQIRSAEELPILFTGALYRRQSVDETYLFDQNIPTFFEHEIRIVAEAQAGAGGFLPAVLDAAGWIARSRRIHFRTGRGAPDCDIFKWKVKNDDRCPNPRGEITDHHTKCDPEETKYVGEHYVECYAIKDDVCIGVGRQNVRLAAQR